MGVRGGGRRNILKITAWHYQAVDMEIYPTLLSGNIWAATQDNLSSGVCEQQRSDQPGICAV